MNSLITGVQKLFGRTNEDRHNFVKICNLIMTIVKKCKSSKMDLKNSPPYIPSDLPDIHSHLMLIFKKNKTGFLQENEYLRVFIGNLKTKLKETVKLFKSSEIYDIESEERRKFTKLSLTFSSILFELKALFPGGNYVGKYYRFAKQEAQKFWNALYPKTNFVPWETFLEDFELLNGIRFVRMSKQEIESLRDTIDLTGDGYVSIYEFDIFTRLFYPFKTLLNNWKTLTTIHPGYGAFQTYDEVKKQLEKLRKPGSYIFRVSCTRPGEWAIGYVAADGNIYQTIPKNSSLVESLRQGEKTGVYLYPNGRQCNFNLASLMPVPEPARLQVTSEQFELYSGMATTFQMCKICDDKEKNVKIEPCGHLLCDTCLTNWQKAAGKSNTCPFCRCVIKGTNQVIIDPFRPNEGQLCEI